MLAVQIALARSSAALLSRFSLGLLLSVVAVHGAASWVGNGSGFSLTSDNLYSLLYAHFCFFWYLAHRVLALSFSCGQAYIGAAITVAKGQQVCCAPSGAPQQGWREGRKTPSSKLGHSFIDTLIFIRHFRKGCTEGFMMVTWVRMAEWRPIMD